MRPWAQWAAKTALLAAGFAAAVLGDSTAGCMSGALAGVTQQRPASGGTAARGAAGVIQRPWPRSRRCSA